MDVHDRGPDRNRFLAPGAVTLWTALLSGFLVIGSDLMWVVSVGDVVRQTGQVPAAVPNLVAAQVEWQNPVVLAQVWLSWVNSLGWAGLPVLHLALVALTLLVLVVDGWRAGASDARLTLAISLVVVGASATFAVIRFPSLSLLPFVVLVTLLRSSDGGTRRVIWCVPPLMILWGNLHGAVLVGLAVLGVFVVVGGRPGLRIRIGVGLVSLSSLVLTSAGLRTPEYYVSALRNEAAVRGTDLWAHPSLGNPLDLAMLVCGAGLVALAARSLRPWEWVVIAGLVIGTLSAARHGVWLLLFLAPIAGVRPSTRVSRPLRLNVPTRATVRAGAVGALALSLVVGVQFVRRTDELQPPGHGLVRVLERIVGDGSVLALEPEAETFAQRGIRVWVANPLDAFPQPTQATFLDFLHDCTVPSTPHNAVVVDDRCVTSVIDQGWSIALTSGDLTVLTK